MNDQPAPLTHDQAVELLSAELDGEFDAAAADLNLTPDEARARLAVTPGVGEHRAALAAAKEGAPVPPVDEATRSALVAHAMEHAPQDELSARRRRSWDARRIGSVAAAFAAVVLGVGAFVALRSSENDKSVTTSAESDALEDRDTAGAGAATEADETTGDDSAASADAAAPEAATTIAPYVDFGDVTDPEALRGRLNEMGAYQAAPAPGAAVSGSDSAVTAPVAGALVDEACVADQAAQYGITQAPVLRGSGVYEGQPVEVVVYAAGDALEAFVIGADCSLLNHQLVRP